MPGADYRYAQCDRCKQPPGYHTVRRTEWRNAQTGHIVEAHGFRLVLQG